MRSTVLSPLKSMPIRDILWLFLGTRLLLIIGTYISFILFPVPPHIYSHTPVDVIGLLNSWDHWDAYRFVTIAQNGYVSAYDTPFFPLLPLLIRGVAFLCDNQGYVAIGMIISNLALLGTLFVLYQLATEVCGAQASRRTLLYLCLFPTAFFFFAAYNESLFLLLTTSTFLALRHQKWWLAGILGLLAALTRSAGVMLAAPFLYELWLTRKRVSEQEKRIGFWVQVWDIARRGWPILLLPLGTLCYCVFCGQTFGAPLAFAVVQNHWGRVTAFPWSGLINAFIELFAIQPFGSFLEVHILLDLAATLGAITLAVLSWRKLPRSFALWITLLVLYMLISPALLQDDTLQSNQRFILEMFPGFIVLATLSLKNSRLHYACLLTFPFLQAIMTVLFVLNRWMV